MRKLKNLSLFKISIILLFYSYTKLFIFTLILIVFIFKNSKINAFINIVLLVLLCFTINNNLNIIRIGIVNRIEVNYFYTNNIFYNTISKGDDVKIGDFVIYTEKGEIIANNNDRIYGNKYSNDNYIVLFNNSLFNACNNRLNNFNDYYNNLFKVVLFNNNGMDICFGFCAYYFFRKIYKFNKKFCLILLIIYSAIFGFDIKLLLIIFNYIAAFFSLNNKNRLGLKVIAFSFIDINLFRNYSIFIPLIFSFLSLIDNKYNFLSFIIQSYIFGSINIFISIFYKIYSNLKAIIFVLCLIVFVFPFLCNISRQILIIFEILFRLFNISIRGKISFISILFVCILKKYTNNKYLFCISIILLLITGLNNPFKKVSFIDVGQGDSILIKGMFNSTKILIDTGSKYNYSKLRNYLFSEGIYKIDYLIITHNDSDHSGNIDNLQNDFVIKNIVQNPIDININDFSLKCLYTGNNNNDNDNSLVYSTTIDDTSFLFTGDISKKIEKLIINKYKIENIDVLKVSHHGSNTATSSYFVGEILPKYAIISTNGKYGHPHEDVINILKSYLVNIYSTNDHGTITFYLFNKVDFIKTDTHFVIIKS